jgi:hypothetical protein
MKRISPALVVATVAVVLAGAGGAVAASQITGNQVENSSLTGADVKNSTLTGADVRNRSLTPADFKGSVSGPAGPAGPQGVAGPVGPQGPPGPHAITDIIGTPVEMCDGDSRGECRIGFAVAQCPDGQVITGGGFGSGEERPPFNNSVIVNDVDETGTAWIVVMVNYGDAANMFATARCVPGTSTPGAAQAGGLSRRDVRARVQRLRAKLNQR